MPTPKKKKIKLAVFDIDGTIFRSSLLTELVSRFVEGGIFRAAAKKEIESAYLAWRNRKGNYENYINALIRVHLKYLPGVSAAAAERIASTVERMAGVVTKAVFGLNTRYDAAFNIRRALRAALTLPYAPVAVICPPDLLEEELEESPELVNAPKLASLSAADARPRFTTAARDLLPDATPRAALGLTADPRPVAAAGPRHLTTPAMITGAAAVVGLGIGIGVGLSARSRFRACEADPASCTEGERDGISSRALIADLGYLTALGAGIATAVLYVTSGNNTGVVVTPGAEGVSVSAVGRF